MINNSYSYKIRPATKEDLNQIRQIEVLSFKDPYPFTLLHQLVQDRNSIALVIELDSNIIGFAFGIIRSGQKGHIVSVAVHPNNRNCRYGGQLVNKLIQILKERGISIIELEVRISNKNAQKMYEKFNFKIKTIRPHYYNDGEDAYLMIYKE
ncbi:MAG TPA: ribosomal protein S18-alanine N-acetyltransferase [Candidatus Deferrimicrobium sp.]|nr:ribosomal protein S18-alanine N-acetyltransferase [Candidatus Deferrimicrobium sp.]